MTRKSLNRALLLVSLFSFAACEEIPKGMQQLLKQPPGVRAYESFSEINPAKPVPAHFNLGLGAVLGAILKKESVLTYSVVPAAKYNAREKQVLQFFEHPGLQKTLRLLAYSRQLKENHAYRVNPFVPFFTDRKENSLFSEKKTGPAALITHLLGPKGMFEGSISWLDPAGALQHFNVKLDPLLWPRTGTMLLFDHDLFSLEMLMANAEQNILQDVILHEFTHIWSHELLSDSKNTAESEQSNRTDTGHDTMLVSNPSLSFSEGLAEGFEALYGTTTSEFMNMSPEERAKFYGGLKAKIAQELDFLVNRQIYVRKNAYAYNLFDFKDCMLRRVQATDSRDQGIGISTEEYLDRLRRGEKVRIEDLLKSVDFKNFMARFYGAQKRISTKDLREHCQYDSPGRLEAKEGFIATLMYDLLRSGALVPNDQLREPASASRRLVRFRSFALQGFEEADPTKPWFPLRTRNPADADSSIAGKIKELERNFLLGFRQLVLGLNAAQSMTLREVLVSLLSDQSVLGTEEQLKVAYEVARLSGGVFWGAGNREDSRMIGLFRDPKALRANMEEVYQTLLRLQQSKDLLHTIDRLGRVPEILVEYPSSIREKTRMNVNLAHHIDLIDMFRENNKQITAMAARLDRGEYFQSEQEFLAFAASMNMDHTARYMLDEARKSLSGKVEGIKVGEARFRTSVFER